jgi:hypothetical protein
MLHCKVYSNTSLHIYTDKHKVPLFRYLQVEDTQASNNRKTEISHMIFHLKLSKVFKQYMYMLIRSLNKMPSYDVHFVSLKTSDGLCQK